ncbi:MAG: 4Fe-4S binding protein, partial [Bacillota bacterium]|nr:4Fe-4S binding protein [Bacillota bacterium]
CEKPTSTCIHFDGEARKYLDRGLGQRLTKEETKELISWTDKKGLMHCINGDYQAKGPAFICNCDGCCCYPFRAGRELATLGQWPMLTYQAVYDEEKCTGCGACLKRCYFQAFDKGGSSHPKVDFNKDKCQGCGLCATTCPAKAIEMRKL